MRVEITLLGDFGVRVDGTAVDPRSWERRQAATLVKLLALAPGRRLHREQCLDAIWPELGVDEAAPRLHKAAHYARKALGDREAIVLRRDEVALFPAARRHDRRDRVRSARRPRPAPRRPGALAVALDRYGGPLLPADPYEPWADSAPRTRAPAPRVDSFAAPQRWDALLAEEPADEEAHVALMRAYVARGDRRAALRQYERMDRALRDELGMVPSEQATRLRDEILAVLPACHRAGARRSTTAWSAANTSSMSSPTCSARWAPAAGAPCSSPGRRESASPRSSSNSASRATALGWRCGIGGAAAIEGAWPYAPVLEAMADLGRRHPTLLDGLDDTYRVGDRPGSAGRRDAGHRRRRRAVPPAPDAAAAGSVINGCSSPRPSSCGSPRPVPGSCS